jgi:hypothetical protein
VLSPASKTIKDDTDMPVINWDESRPGKNVPYKLNYTTVAIFASTKIRFMPIRYNYYKYLQIEGVMVI